MGYRASPTFARRASVGGTLGCGQPGPGVSCSRTGFLLFRRGNSMKRSLGALGIFFFAALGAGCPVYSDNVISVECYYATDCPTGYRCSYGACVQAPPHVGSVRDGGGTSSDASDAASDRSDAASDASADGGIADSSSEGSTDAPAGEAGLIVYCGNPSDCTSTETCSTDGTCHRGNCSMNACINQYQCSIEASGPACVRGDSKGCGADRHCLSTERCIDGTCTSVTELCTDRAQCGTGKRCADGRCVTACTADGQCPAGFLCRTALGVCGAKAKPCLQTSDCGSKDQVCVDGACVPRCAASGACGGGSGVCVDNGCVPTTNVAPECDRQGTSTGCPAGGICLHHHCYMTCGADAGTCNAQSSAPVCKTVTVAGASYSVCGASDTLGPDCDLSAGRPCTDGKSCIDGYCK
jgi:hypothetical protein